MKTLTQAEIIDELRNISDDISKLQRRMKHLLKLLDKASALEKESVLSDESYNDALNNNYDIRVNNISIVAITREKYIKEVDSKFQSRSSANKNIEFIKNVLSVNGSMLLCNVSNDKDTFNYAILDKSNQQNIKGVVKVIFKNDSIKDIHIERFR